MNRDLLVGNCRKRLGNHKIIQYYLNRFQANISFPYFLKTSKNLCVSYVLMGYRNRALIWNGLMLTNCSFFQCCSLIFNIMCCSWAFHSAFFYLIRAGKKNTSWKVHIFLCETQNGVKNAIFSLKQDNNSCFKGL